MISINNNEQLASLFSALFEEHELRHSLTSSDDILKFHPINRNSNTFEPIPLDCSSDPTIPTKPVKFNINTHNNNQPQSLEIPLQTQQSASTFPIQTQQSASTCPIQTQQSAFAFPIQTQQSANTCELKDTDVICGRSKSAFEHIGNRRFRVTISIFLRRYLENTNRLDRSMLIYEIIDTVHESGSRFLKESSNGEWVELSQKERRNKVGHALRDAAGAYRRNRRNQ